MKTVILSQALSTFKDEFESLDSSGKIYRTTVHSLVSPVSETFVTASKDLHLEFGRLSEELQWEIAALVRRELRNGGGVLCLRAKEDTPVAVLATIVKGDKQVIHLSKVTP